MVDLIRLELSRFFIFFLIMKEVKTCQDCEMGFRWKGSFSRPKKVTYCYCQTWKWHLSFLKAKFRKWWRKQLTRLLIINSDDFIVRMCYKSKLVDSDHENFTKLCQILQTSIEHNSIEVLQKLWKIWSCKIKIYSQCW